MGALGLALGLVVWGARLAVVGRYGSDLPQADQWDAEGLHLIVAQSQGGLSLGSFFAPHNEHIILWTRLLALLELKGNGLWDARLGCVVNAALHAVAAGLLWRWLVRWVVPDAPAGAWIAVALAVALPFSSHNILASFHSQQAFMAGFSLLAFALLPVAAPASSAWWGGVGCLVAALFSMGAGLLAAVAVGTVAAVHALASHTLRRVWPTLAACLAVCLLGWELRVEVPAHAGYAAASAADFAGALLRQVIWPVHRFGLGVFAVLPMAAAWAAWLWLAGQVCRRRGGKGELALLAAGLWVWLQMAAAAWARGAGAPAPPSRYLDTLVIGAGVAMAAWYVARTRPASGVALPRWLDWVGRAGLAVLLAGLATEAVVSVGWQLPERHASYQRGETAVREYLAGGNPASLRTDDIPYPDPVTLRARLDEPAIRQVLPPSLRPPLPPADAPGSVIAAALAQHGLLVLLAGVLLALGVVVRRAGSTQNSTLSRAAGHSPKP